MEEPTTQPRPYELAYHLMADIEESAALARMHELEKLITSQGGNIIASREPKKIHLSYPLSHKHYAFFGVMDFRGMPELIEELNQQMKLQEGILRYMIVKKPEEGKELRTLGDQRSKKAQVRVAPTHVKVPGEGTTGKKEAAPVAEKQIEKELSDVLEKI